MSNLITEVENALRETKFAAGWEKTLPLPNGKTLKVLKTKRGWRYGLDGDLGRHTKYDGILTCAMEITDYATR